MKHSKTSIILFLFPVLFCGCSHLDEIADIPKVIWGSSTRALEKARADSMQKIFKCGFDECYDVVLGLAGYFNPATSTVFKQQLEDSAEELTEEEKEAIMKPKSPFVLFKKNRAKKYMVIMHVPGSIDTTEVGVFFVELDGSVKVEVSSLSRGAKLVASDLIFTELGNKFSVVE